MARILVYTSPARGHLFPLVPTLQELQGRGHEIVLRTLAPEVERMRALGFRTEALGASVEGRELDDWKAGNPVGAMLRALRTFMERAPGEVEDLRAGVVVERPDALLVDINTWGAQAAAEASGLPWAAFSPYLLPFRAPGIPPWGLGLQPREDGLGRLRDWALWGLLDWLQDRRLPDLNRLRRAAGSREFQHVRDWCMAPPLLLYYTAEPFEHPRPWPSGVRLVGPGLWEPSAAAVELPEGPLVLVTCSTEFQDDGRLIATALEALADEPVHVVATTAALDPAQFRAPRNATVRRFVPHGQVLPRAACVVCHGGMGITQKALAHGVPVCAVPFGRDQLEVAAHVVHAGAGTTVPAGRLSVPRLRQAVRRAVSLRTGAERIAEAFRRAGGATAAADALEGLVSGRMEACVR